MSTLARMLGRARGRGRQPGDPASDHEWSPGGHAPPWDRIRRSTGRAARTRRFRG